MAIQIQSNISLQAYNTFGIDANAKSFCEIECIADLQELKTKEEFDSERLVLGGGSNMLLLNNWNGLVILNSVKGISIENENPESVLLKVGAGEVWHDFVLYTVNNEYYGIENLSLIPGSVGASPIQNIGAYGVEIKDTFEKLEAFNIATGQVETFSKEDCKFGYRESVFKKELKGKYIITQVYYRLSKMPSFNTSYGAIEEQLAERGIDNPSIKDISNAVISIRQSKLPDPKEIGNSGSFFKNPVIDSEQAKKLKEQFPKMVQYPVDNGVKLAAGWLIESCGWKGYKENGFGVHDKQALVLVHYGGASGQDIYNLSQKIIDSIYETYGVSLEREVNMISSI
jgi:UDP-N-acetylmuramate dehydrogenase